MQAGVADDGLDDPLHLLSLTHPENLLERWYKYSFYKNNSGIDHRPDSDWVLDKGQVSKVGQCIF